MMFQRVDVTKIITKIHLFGLVLAMFLAFTLLGTPPAGAITVTVSDPNDSSTPVAGMLREAIQNSAVDVINFSVPTVTLTYDELYIDRNLTLNGPVTIERNTSAGHFRIFNIDGTSPMVTLNSVIIQNGYADDTVTPYTGGGALKVGSTSSVTLSGCELRNNTTRNGDGVNGVNAASGGAIYSLGTVSLTGCYVHDNTTGNGFDDGVNPGGNGGDGAGIYNLGDLSIAQSTISSNTTGAGATTVANNAGAGGQGGGIFNDGSWGASIINSTISGNQTGAGGSATTGVGGNGGKGGGIYHDLPASLNIQGSTIVNNHVGPGGPGSPSGTAGQGGGIHVEPSSFVWQGQSILANNTTSGSLSDGPDCHGEIRTTDYNLVGIETSVYSTSNCDITTGGSALNDIFDQDPNIGGLANNGGLGLTHALLTGSPAIDRGASTAPPAPSQDQRGVIRPQGPATDIGAYEARYYGLSLAKAGLGDGTVTSSPSGIDCGAGCSSASTDFVEGTVSLTAVPETGAVFGGWSGDCSGGSSIYNLLMNDNKFCTATFNVSTYTISGYVKTASGTGVSGVTLEGLPNTPVTDADGFYKDTADPGWSGTVTPALTGYEFSPEIREYSSVNKDLTDQNYTAVRVYVISGKVELSPGVGLEEVVMEGLPGDPVTTADGSYSATVSSGWSGVVTPKLLGYIFDPISRTYTNVSADHLGQDFVASQGLLISGLVRYLGIGLANVVLKGLPGDPATGSNGSYITTVPQDWFGRVIPALAGYAFNPSSRTYAGITTNQSNQDYTAMEGYTISGKVETSPGVGLPGVVMSGLPGDPVTDATGAYSAGVPEGWSDMVTPTLTGYTFDPESRAYTNVISDLVDQNYTAKTAFVISGQVEISAGVGLPNVVMKGLPGDPATDAAGLYHATVPPNWSGDAVPTLAGYLFNPESRTYTNVNTNLTEENYTAAAVYIISGKVETSLGSGLPGVTMNGLPGSPTTQADGSYSAQAPGGWSGTVKPTLDGYSFTPPSRVYTNVTTDMADQNYTAAKTAYTISGQVRLSDGSPVSGITLSGLPGSPITAGDGSYSDQVPAGWSGTVVPNLSGYTFTPSSTSYSNVTSDHPNQDYTAVPGPVTYTISGQVRLSDGSPVSGVTLSGLPDSPVTGADGSYSDQVPAEWSGTVIPSLSGYTFTPPSTSYSNVTSDHPGQNYTAVPGPAAYTINGHVRLSDGSPVSGVILSGLPGSPVTTGDGSYSDQVPAGWSGTVTPLSSEYLFNPPSRAYTHVGSNHSNQDYTATPATAVYTISGRVETAARSGLPGVLMEGLPGRPETNAEGYYSAAVPEGWSGTVVPEKAGYQFSPASIAYSPVFTDQTGQNYTAEQTHIISGTVRTTNGQGLAGVVMNGFPEETVTNAQGQYETMVVSGWTGTIVPTKAGFDFSPSFRPYTPVDADMADQDYTALHLYTLSGRVATSDGAELSNVLLMGHPPFKQRYFSADDGAFAVATAEGYTGRMLPLKPGYRFTPEYRGYPAPGVNQNQGGQDFTAAAVPAQEDGTAVPGGSTQPEYDIYGFTLHPINPAPTTVFGIPADQYDKTRIRIGRWDPTLNVYVEYPFNDLMEQIGPGWSAWVLSRSPRDFEVKGYQPATLPGPTGRGVFFPVRKGWNQVANPFGHPVYMNRVRLVTLTGDSAVTFWVWIKGEMRYAVIPENGAIEAVKGGWVWADGDGYLFFEETRASDAIVRESFPIEALQYLRRPPTPPKALNAPGATSGGGEGGGGGCFIKTLVER